jgi:hypothetical protein
MTTAGRYSTATPSVRVPIEDVTEAGIDTRPMTSDFVFPAAGRVEMVDGPEYKQLKVEFGNGYGVSLVQVKETSLCELGVLHGVEFCFATEVGHQVLVGLTKAQAEALVALVARLSPIDNCRHGAPQRFTVGRERDGGLSV